MAFVVEDGTGLATATSLVSVADADTYWTDRVGDNAAWLALDEDVKQRQLILASDYMRNTRRYNWTGNRKLVTQRQPWPRTGAFERGAGAIGDSVVPFQVVEAVAYLALGATNPTTLQPDLERGNAIASESVGSLSVSYRPDAPPETVIQVVDGLLEALTKNRRLPLQPTYAVPTDVSPLYSGMERSDADG